MAGTGGMPYGRYGINEDVEGTYPDEQTFGSDRGYNYGTYWPKYDTSIPISVKNYSEGEIVRFINDRLWGGYQAKNYQKMVDDLPQMHRAYEGVFKNQNIPSWRSQLYVRFAFKAVETLRAYFQDALFANLPYIIVDPSHAKNAAGGKNLEKLFDYEMYHTNFELRMMDVVNYVLKYGTAWTKTYWRWYVDYQHTADFKKNKYGFVERNGSKGKKYVKWDDPWMMPVDPRKLIPDPEAIYTDTLRWIIEEDTIDLDQLQKDKNRYGYFNLHRLQNEQRGYRQYGPKFDYVSRDVYPRNEWNSQLDYNRRRVFIDEYWGRLDMPGNQDDPRFYCITMANNRHVIRIKPLPYAHGELPFQCWNMIPREENLYGIGAVEPVLADNFIMNALVNMRIDSMHLYINPRLIVNRGAFANRRSIENVRPGELINVNSTADIGRTHQQLIIQDTGMNTWRDQMEWHQRHGEETMAINPNAAGQLARSKRSATESAMAMEGANARFTSMVKMFKFTGMDNMIRQYGQLMQQYSGEKRFKIINPTSAEEKDAILTVRPEDIQGEFMYRLKDNTITNKNVRQALVTQLLGVVAPLAQVLQMDAKPLVKGILELSPIADKMNLDEVFPEASPDVMNQEQPELERILQSPDAQGPRGNQGAAVTGVAPERQVLQQMAQAGGF